MNTPKPGEGAIPRLHVITSDEVARQPAVANAARAIASLGAVAMHARAPTLGGRACWRLACTLWEAARGTAAWVVVNDRLDVARAIGASGVQLPGHGLTVAAARAILDPTIAIGQSVHSAEAARVLFAAGADYVLLGPIWETASHPGTAPLGLDAIRRALPARIVAIGGITDTQRARACCAAGAYGVAVIRAVWHDADPRGAARRILLSLPR